MHMVRVSSSQSPHYFYPAYTLMVQTALWKTLLPFVMTSHRTQGSQHEPIRHQTVVDKLKKFAHLEAPIGSCIPANVNGTKASSSEQQKEPEQEPTLRQVSKQLLTAIRVCKISLCGKTEEIKIDCWSVVPKSAKHGKELLLRMMNRISDLKDQFNLIPAKLSKT